MSQPVSLYALHQWRSSALAQARSQGLELAGVDWLLREYAGVDRLYLHWADHPGEVVLPCTLDDLDQLWQAHRSQQIPLQYLVGFTPWRNLRLRVAPGVLIPRPETELIIEIALEVLRQEPALSEGAWVDLGTGSGAIPIALALEAPPLSLHGVDISPDALRIAQGNAQTYGLSSPQPTALDRIQWHLGSWFSPFSAWKGAGTIGAMLANPPYIPTDMVAGLSPLVRDHEPNLALDGGSTGLAALDHLIVTAPDYVRSGGLWLVEVMAGQAITVAQHLEQTHHYDRIILHADLAGIDRFVSARIR